MTDPATTSERLRAQFAKAAESDAAIDALLIEACRIADRLDRIHEVETAKVDWFELLRFRTQREAGDEITVTIDNVISEARAVLRGTRTVAAKGDSPPKFAVCESRYAPGSDFAGGGRGWCPVASLTTPREWLWLRVPRVGCSSTNICRATGCTCGR